MRCYANYLRHRNCFLVFLKFLRFLIIKLNHKSSISDNPLIRDEALEVIVGVLGGEGRREGWSRSLILNLEF